MRKTISLIAAGAIIAVATALTVMPVQGVLGMDAGTLGAVEVAVATLMATVLMWYGLRTG